MSRREKIIEALVSVMGTGLWTEQAETLYTGLLADGWVILRAESVRRAQERQRIAEARLDCAERDRANAYVWARDCCAEERRLRERLTFVYGVARAHGATVDELNGP